MITTEELETLYVLYRNTKLNIEDLETDPLIQLYNKAKEQMETQEKELADWAATLGAAVEDSRWAKDTFSKGKKEVVTDGKMRIYRSGKTTRTIRTKNFVATYPFLANEMIEKGIIKVPIKATEDEIGKKELDAICDKTKTYKYELTFWKEEQHDQLRIHPEAEGEGQPVPNVQG